MAQLIKKKSCLSCHELVERVLNSFWDDFRS